MKKLLLIGASAILLSSCGIIPVHKMDIQQGNIMTPEMTDKLHTGMTESQVKELMGDPVLLNTFNDHRLDYVYTFKAGNKPQTEQRVTLVFNRGILTSINKN